MLDLTNSQYHIGMLIIKSIYLEPSTSIQDDLFKLIKERCKLASLIHYEISAIIVLNMVINKPLASQYKKLKSLNRRFGYHAKIYKRLQSKQKAELKKLYGKPESSDINYLIEQLEQLEQANSQSKILFSQHIDKLSQSSTKCPQCNGNGCVVCSQGYVRATMKDVQK